MLNYEVDPGVLQPLVPVGTELDQWNGRTFINLVGFMFLDTRILGVGIPRHRDFEEVNLRFYVRRRASDGWRRGVVFIKEIVPRRAIAFIARVLYGENYIALPMDHRIEEHNGAPSSASYSWWLHGKENHIRLSVAPEPCQVEEGSNAEFITEHYWGYARRRGGRTTEYQVEHPRWRVRVAEESQMDCDVAALYGDRFVEPMRARPVSAFLAEGAEVTVFRGRDCV